MSDYHPEWFGGNNDAAALISQFCFVAHVWDDLVDRDREVSEDRINQAFELSLSVIPTNPFYIQHRGAIAPLIHTGVLGFVTANRMQRSGDPHQIEIAHGLRYAVAQVAVLAISFTNSREQALEILPLAWQALMPERFSEFAQEHAS